MLRIYLTGVHPALLSSALIMTKAAQRIGEILSLTPLCRPAVHRFLEDPAGGPGEFWRLKAPTGVLCFMPTTTGFICLRSQPVAERLELILDAASRGPCANTALIPFIRETFHGELRLESES